MLPAGLASIRSANRNPYREKGERRDRLPKKDTVWCVCEYANDRDYRPLARENGYGRAGRYDPKKAYLRAIPEDGFYRFKTSPVMMGDWIISGAIRVIRVLPDREVDAILLDHHIEPMPRDGGPINLMAYGFAER